RALLICGPPSSGQSTLVEALLRAGASYYSDQYAVLDARGRVHAYPNPLTGKPQEAFCGQAGTKPLPVGMVLVTQYRAKTRLRPRLLSPGQAVLALLAYTVPARLRPKVALATLRRVAASATAFRGKRGEAEETALTLLSCLSNPNHHGRLTTISPA